MKIVANMVVAWPQSLIAVYFWKLLSYGFHLSTPVRLTIIRKVGRNPCGSDVKKWRTGKYAAHKAADVDICRPHVR